MIAIIDCRVGNLFSVLNAFRFIGEKPFIAKTRDDVAKAKRILLPGVGAFPDAMASLIESGLIETIRTKVLGDATPLLGICLGMQLLAEKSSEKGTTNGLGFIPAEVKKLQPGAPNFRIPHVGWNNIVSKGDNSLFLEGIPEKADFYFVHSYHVIVKSPDIKVTTCDHGGEFTAGYQYKNIFGVQFHPELSHNNGLQILKNFISFKH